jgi:hypothetical protein
MLDEKKQYMWFCGILLLAALCTASILYVNEEHMYKLEFLCMPWKYVVKKFLQHAWYG